MMNRIELKQEAKGVVRTAAVSAYLFALLYLALTELLQGASVYVNGDVVLYMQTYFPNVPIPSYLYPVALPTTVVTLVAVVCWLLRVLLQGGWVLYHLGVRRGEEMPYATLFDGFGFIGKLILLNIVITLYVFLWSMLFIIPGIIASYRYRFAVYNLCENPDIGVMEAISMSKAQTAGYKGDLFLLDLTFIGWNLLCSLTLGILSIWIAPYIIQTNIGYFQEIKRIKGIGWQARPEQPDDTFRPMVRIATDHDRRVLERNRAREKEAFDVCQKKILQHKLEMKLVRVECSFDGNKILFFFTADGRVDFRELVKDLASAFRARIELRQIGVRDEAKMLGGLGICGRPFCCAQFLDDFMPVSIKMEFYFSHGQQPLLNHSPSEWFSEYKKRGPQPRCGPLPS